MCGADDDAEGRPLNAFDTAGTAGGGTASATLVTLLDYVEEVVRLDERVAFRLADYRLPGGAALSITSQAVAGLPGVATDLRDGETSAWLAVDRLVRQPPPAPPPRLAPWLGEFTDPAAPPHALPEILRGVTAAERSALVAADRAAEEDFAPVPSPGPSAPEDAAGPCGWELRLRFADQHGLAEALELWRTGPWGEWAAAETLRRRTIALYGQLYALHQQLELGGGDSAVEVVWGIGTVDWTRDGRRVERPLIDCAVEIEIDRDGCLTVRPTGADPRIDLKPYEAMGCGDLGAVEALARAEFARADAEDGVSPFRPDSTAPLLRGVATRLAAEGFYRADAAVPAPPAAGPVVTGDWVLYARPRSQHVLLDDIARFRAQAAAGRPVAGLAARLVTRPDGDAVGGWEPLGDRLGTAAAEGEALSPEGDPGFGDVFFPKPFNEDQVAIVRRLAQAEGLVVQGPPGTGKTHTIANIICHAMALGQRVLVVSRGEAALSVLRDQLPEKVRPLTIAILSSERQGLRQVESAIREIQSVVEESRPEIRLAAIRRCEAEIVKIRLRLDAIDAEVDGIAELQRVAIGPAALLPADLARQVAAERDGHAWFDDTPWLFAGEAGLSDAAMADLRRARAAAGPYLDHLDAALPPTASLPSVEEVAGWHDDLLADGRASTAADPARALHLAPGFAAAAARAVRALDAVAAAAEALASQPWLQPLVSDLLRRDASNWTALLQGCCDDWHEIERERGRLAGFAVELPPGLDGDREAREAVLRGARGERPWPRLALGQGGAKDRVAAIRLRGQPLGRDPEDWRAAADAVALALRRTALAARWRHLAVESGGAPGAEPGAPAGAARLLALVSEVQAASGDLGMAAQHFPSPEALALDPARARALAARIADAAEAARLVDVTRSVGDASALFAGGDRTSVMARQILDQLVGRPDLTVEKVAALWRALLTRLDEVMAQAGNLDAVRAGTAAIVDAGAPCWAARLRADPDPAALPETWRRAWDAAAAERRLGHIDRRDTLSALARERDAADRRGRKLFVELVRERAFFALERRLSPRVKSALVEYVRALGRLGKGTGKTAGRQRRVARDAMARCYDAVPCWIMPSWRVAEQLPSDMAAFDLVILDEASQSDVTELPALLRGRKILAVGDDRQVSPTPPFVTQARIAQLRHRYLRHLPYAALLEPGESLYDLMRAVFPDSRLMLREHFRCVEPIIRFSMQFYPETLIPLRVPASAERLDPPLVDILVPHGARDGARKINRAEAEVIVDEVAALIASPEGAGRSVGVISLIGGEQAELVRVLLTDRIGDEAMQRHRVLCSDSAGFQGNERDVVFLSMVADRKRRQSLTMQRYEQRFNVAASRARDRLVLVRSVGRQDLAAADLKFKLIAHFEHPMPEAPPCADLAERCDSGFERDMLARLLALGYRVTPQVGAEGFRIDLVVEDAGGRRLAVECDGDGFHRPERWRDDMRRQRILERVGWRFWRCFASSFYRDPDGVMADLVATLEREGVAPAAGHAGRAAGDRLVEHRIAAAPPPEAAPPAAATRVADGAPADRIAVGDRVALLFADSRRLTLRLTEGADDRPAGLLSVTTPLGAAIVLAEEGDEVEVAEVGGAPTRVLVEAVMRAA